MSRLCRPKPNHIRQNETEGRPWIRAALLCFFKHELPSISMNYSLILFASDVPRFLVIHTTKPHSRESRHSREGGSSYAHWNAQYGRPELKTFRKKCFWTDYLERKDARPCVSTCQRIVTRQNLACHFRIPFVRPTMFFSNINSHQLTMNFLSTWQKFQEEQKKRKNLVFFLVKTLA